MFVKFLKIYYYTKKYFLKVRPTAKLCLIIPNRDKHAIFLFILT